MYILMNEIIIKHYIKSRYDSSLKILNNIYRKKGRDRERKTFITSKTDRLSRTSLIV